MRTNNSHNSSSHCYRKTIPIHCSTSPTSGNGSSPSPAASPVHLKILHFNDVYNVEAKPKEPAGGAARFVALSRKLRHEINSDTNSLLTLFSGDALSPSLMSSFTHGEQMVPVLNDIGVHAAVIGNHDFDFGVSTLKQYFKQFQFPWLLSNIVDIKTNQPLAGAKVFHILEWHGHRIGLIGLVEHDWMLTIPSLDERDVIYTDFVEAGRLLATDLWTNHDISCCIALTHMRSVNDKKLAEMVPEIQLVLGGHDHDYEVQQVPPHGTMVFKSGTDFREGTLLTCTFPLYHPHPHSASIHTTNIMPPRPTIEWEKLEVTSDMPEDEATAKLVESYQKVMGSKMDEPLGISFVDLDARFETVRTQESNIGNFLADISKLSLGADLAFLNGGTIRSDQIHHQGQLVMRDFVSLLPYSDETLVLVELTGKEVLQCLETGVSKYPSKEGRFLQISGVNFTFDPSTTLNRVIADSVQVNGEPLDMERRYKCATKQYLRGGKDGFEMLKSAKVLMNGETAPRLATLVQFILSRIQSLNNAEKKNRTGSCMAADTSIGNTSSGRSSNNNNNVSRSSSSDEEERAVDVRLLQKPDPCPHGLDALYFYDRSRRRFGIAPRVEGRIQIVNDV